MEPDDVREAVTLIESFLQSNPTRNGCSLFVVGYCNVLEIFVAFNIGDNLQKTTYMDYTNYPFHAIGLGSGIGKLTWRRKTASKTMDDRDSVAMVVKEALVRACMDDPCCGGLLRLRWVGKRMVDPIETDEHLIDAMLSTQTPLKKTDIMFSKVSHDHINYNTIMKHFQNDYHCQLKKNP
ncbi:hypothetical protein CASFOL_041958 [Castilleja foliolosa]|uniref:Uncharacterized protein n=1 Tax=Castilleja foliolosa TaxID=1961234 RepID=A0ABD3B9F2_9LAMI